MIDETEFSYFGFKVVYTTGFIRESPALVDFIRGGYIEDEEAGRIFCKVGFIDKLDSYGNWTKKETHVYIPAQVTDNGTHVEAKTIEF